MSTTTTSTFKSSSPHSLYNRPLRISDILSLPEEHDVVSNSTSPHLMDASTDQSSCTTVPCTAPHRIVSKLLKWTKRVKREKQSDLHHRTGVIDGQGLGHSVAQNRFNVGVGCGLLYVVAASKTELNKMAELRTQMETLLESTKQELQKKHTFSDPNQIQASPQTVTASSYELQDSSMVTLSDESLKCEEFREDDEEEEEECVGGIDRLQAELESELERLQGQLDGEKKLLNHSWQRSSLREVIEENASKNCDASSGEVIDPAIDPEFECMDLQCAVSPYELERRLHELLESRQQEQIQELEGGLEYLKRKLLEKEFEVSWWKDTARLISRHAAESSRITSHRDRNSCISR